LRLDANEIHLEPVQARICAIAFLSEALSRSRIGASERIFLAEDQLPEAPIGREVQWAGTGKSSNHGARVQTGELAPSTGGGSRDDGNDAGQLACLRQIHHRFDL
jgi:hypothetical protein